MKRTVLPAARLDTPVTMVTTRGKKSQLEPETRDLSRSGSKFENVAVRWPQMNIYQTVAEGASRGAELSRAEFMFPTRHMP